MLFIYPKIVLKNAAKVTKQQGSNYILNSPYDNYKLLIKTSVNSRMYFLSLPKFAENASLIECCQIAKPVILTCKNAG
jgi:hypothetical protein